MSNNNDRSLSSGVSFPQWMKQKISDRLDFDQATFSPTEDSFLVLHYQKKIEEGERNSEQNKMPEKPQLKSAQIFSSHTAPCQEVILNKNGRSQVQAVTSDLPPVKYKSVGTDDGFKGEAAACGSSVVRVAHQMVSKKITTGFATPNLSDDKPSEPKNFYPSVRRGSKSLPSSPLMSPSTSPKTKRRIQNKYFTGAFVDAEHYPGNWILSGLLGKRENISGSVGTIPEDVEDKHNLVKGLSDVDVTKTKETNSEQTFKAKPSELREMNFWSPTSM